MVAHTAISVSLRAKRGVGVLLTLLMLTSMSRGQVAIGQWQDHFSYNTALHLAVGGNYIYTAYTNAAAEYDRKEGVIGRLSKTTGLSDAGISTIGYDAMSGSLVIGYTNSNIDIVQHDVVYNLSDLRRALTAGNKAIYDVAFLNKKAYISTGIGILVIDLERREIETTCYLGAEGTPIAVYSVAAAGGRLYAATEAGLYSINSSSKYPNISTLWQRDDTSLLSTRKITRLRNIDDDLVALTQSNNAKTHEVYHVGSAGVVMIDSGDVQSVECYGNLTTVTKRDRVRVFDKDNTLKKEISTFTYGDLILHDAVALDDGTVVMAHDWAGTYIMGSNGQVTSLNPKGNVSDNVYGLTSFDDVAYLAPGGRSTTNANLWIPANVFNYKKNEWNQLQSNKKIAGVTDVLQVAVDPTNPNHLAAAALGYGIIEIVSNNVITLHNEESTNGVIETYWIGDWSAVRTGAVRFDREGVLWAYNSLVENGLLRMGRDGKWNSYETRSLTGTTEIDRLVCDSVRGYKWFTGKGNKIYVHDGDSRYAYVDANNGSRLTTNRVNCIEQDRDGDIWIGTDKGIKVIFDGYKALENVDSDGKSPATCSNIVISGGDFAEYLMAYEDVTTIAVDGANRKWIGTRANGIYLISSTGLEELEHFTTTNSALPSDQIVAVTVIPRTGEVLIGTSKGTVGYRSTATYGTSMPQKKVYAYPNPVRPDYDGPIAIKGLTNNAMVHITDAAGHVVFSSKASGGQVIWNGRKLDGENVVSGVYLVFASDHEGGNRSVAKVLVIR